MSSKDIEVHIDFAQGLKRVGLLRRSPRRDGETVTFEYDDAWLQDPAPVDLVEWLHGMGITPWLKSGPVVTSANMNAFEELVSGNGVLFAIWFN